MPSTQAARTARAITCAVLLIACDADDSVRKRALDETPARQLVGAWDAQFVVERSPGRQVARADGPGTAVRGIITLVEDRKGTVYPDLGVALHSGAYDIDFRPLGFDPHVSGEPPTVAATTLGVATGGHWPDSVVVMISPQLAGRGTIRGVVLRGRLAGDSVTGRWFAGGAPPFGAHGTFVLRRRSR